MSYEDWCIEEERRYIFGGTAEVFMPDALVKLHETLISRIEKLPDIFTKQDVIKLIDDIFGEQL